MELFIFVAVKICALNEEIPQTSFVGETWLFIHLGVGGLSTKRESVEGGGIGVGFIGLGWAVESYRVRSVTVVGVGARSMHRLVTMAGGAEAEEQLKWQDG